MQDRTNAPVSYTGLVAGLRSISSLDTPISPFRSKMTCQEPHITVNPIDSTMTGADQGGIWIPAPEPVSPHLWNDDFTFCWCDGREAPDMESGALCLPHEVVPFPDRVEEH